MKPTKTKPASLSPIFKAIGDCLTPELAKRVLAMKPTKSHVARMNYLADQCNEGQLAPEERAEYAQHIDIGTELSILKSKARLFLARTSAA